MAAPLNNPKPSTSTDNWMQVYMDTRPFEPPMPFLLNDNQLNGILNPNFLNNFLTGDTSTATTIADPSIKRKASKPKEVDNDITTSTYRVLYHLYNKQKDNENLENMWNSIAHEYNFITKSECTPDEVMNIWKRMPSMEKRKFMLDNFTEDNQSESPVKKKSKKSADKNSHKKIAAVDIQSDSTMNNIPVGFNQSQPFDFSTTNKEIKQKKVSFSRGDTKIKAQKKNQQSCNKSIQANMGKEELKEEHKWKIAILKLRLKYLQKQYAKL